MKLQDIKLKNIVVNVNQPRKYFDREKLEELKKSIENNGLIQPIVVRKLEQGINKGNYEIIAGERRFRACELLGMESLKAIVIQAGDSKSYEYSILENIQRENLNIIEEAESYLMLMEVYGYNQEKLAEKLGKTRSSISNKIRLLKLSEKTKEYLKTGELSYGQGRALLGLKNKEEIEEIAKKIIDKGYTVRDVEKIVRKLNDSQEEKVKIFKDKEKENFTLEVYDENSEEREFLEGKLREFFETKVHIRGDLKGSGKLEINYCDYEELGRIIGLLNIDFE